MGMRRNPGMAVYTEEFSDSWKLRVARAASGLPAAKPGSIPCHRPEKLKCPGSNTEEFTPRSVAVETLILALEAKVHPKGAAGQVGSEAQAARVASQTPCSPC